MSLQLGKQRAGWLGFWITLLFLASFAVPVSATTHLSPAELRGRQIYMKTTSPSGVEIKAYIGKESFEAPGSAVACVHCHGRDGRGLEEAGVTATDITWEELTKPYGVKRPKGREHPAYSEETLYRAIADGIDPAGNRLDPVMPRYILSPEDHEDLVAFLKRIGALLDPGLSPRSVTVGTVLPGKGHLDSLGQAVRSILEAYFSELNAQGGIFNRTVELQTVAIDEGAPADVREAERMVSEGEVFAILSPLTPGADSEMAALAEAGEVPLIGPLTLYPEDIASLNRYTFYLFSGLREQLRALVVFARRELAMDGKGVGLLYPDDGLPADVVEAVERQITAEGWKLEVREEYSRSGCDPAALARRLQEKGVRVLFFLGPWEAVRDVLQSGVKEGWTPTVFLSGSQAKRDIFDLPEELQSRLFLAYPTLPSDHTEYGLTAFENLSVKYSLTRDHLATQIAAYCAAKVFVEGLRLAGRDVTREKLVGALENLYDFDTGLMPRITFDPNRRIGALGAHVVTVDLRKKSFVPVGSWISLKAY